RWPTHSPLPRPARIAQPTSAKFPFFLQRLPPPPLSNDSRPPAFSLAQTAARPNSPMPPRFPHSVLARVATLSPRPLPLHLRTESLPSHSTTPRSRLPQSRPNTTVPPRRASLRSTASPPAPAASPALSSTLLPSIRMIPARKPARRAPRLH